MKKFFITLILAIFTMTILSGCDSCTPPNEVSYQLNWANNPTSGYTETCVYDVTYSSNFNENGFNYSKSDIGVDILVTDGVYTTTTQIVSPNGIDIPDEDKHLDADYNRTFYKLTTALNLNISYTINNVTETFNDKVTSTTYFYDQNNGFAPIYSIKSYDTTNIEIGANGKANKIVRYIYDTTTVYNKGDFTITFNQDKNLPKDTALSYVPEVNAITKTGKGNYKVFIDNETLLFSLRNLNLSNNIYLDVVIPSFVGVEEVVTSKVISGKNTVNMSINGGAHSDVSIDTTTVAYCRSDETFTGSPILATIQTDGLTYNDTTYNNAYLVKLVTRLPSYSGAICYTLNSVTVTH